MAKPSNAVTPPDRFDTWKRKWGKSRPLDDRATDAAFDEFLEAFVVGHMRSRFLKAFGVPKAKFGNRFFMEDAAFYNLDTRLDKLEVRAEGHVEVTVIYPSTDRMEGHQMRGELRRTLKDIVVDDWHAACAIVRTSGRTLYLFAEPGGGGCIVRAVAPEGHKERLEEPPVLA